MGLLGLKVPNQATLVVVSRCGGGLCNPLVIYLLPASTVIGTMSQESSKQTARVLRFTTRGIVPDNRVQLWEGHNARALLPLDIRTIDAKPLHAEETNLHLPSVRMASVFGTSQIVERSEDFIGDNPTGVIAIFFATEGEAFFFHRGGNISLRPGQAIVYDADRPFLRGFNQGFRELVLTIPKSMYHDLVGTPGPELPAVFEFGRGGGSGEQALAALIQTTLRRIAAGEPRHLTHTEPTLAVDPEPQVLSVADAEEEVLSLVRLVLGEAADSETGLVAAAQHHIELNITDPGLNTAQVAAAIGISERQLGRLFAESDTTVGRYVLAKRLDLARRALADPEQAGLSVAEVGKRFGFSSQSHFGRTFRKRFDCTPLQWRKEAQRRNRQS